MTVLLSVFPAVNQGNGWRGGGVFTLQMLDQVMLVCTPQQSATDCQTIRADSVMLNRLCFSVQFIQFLTILIYLINCAFYFQQETLKLTLFTYGTWETSSNYQQIFACSKSFFVTIDTNYVGSLLLIPLYILILTHPSRLYFIGKVIFYCYL